MLEIVISIVATAIVSVLIARWQMKKNRIDHYIINSYDIGKGLTDVFPEFQLHYGDEVLSKNVKVLQGGFMNAGRNDIGENGKQEDITVILPEGCTVKAVKVSPLVNGLVVEHIETETKDDGTKRSKKKNEIIIRITGLFRSKERFKYSAIVEVPENMPNIDNIKFEHRIANTKDIKSYQNGSNQYNSNIAFKVMCLFFTVMMSWGLFSILYFESSRERVFDNPLYGIVLTNILVISIIIFGMLALKQDNVLNNNKNRKENI